MVTLCVSAAEDVQACGKRSEDTCWARFGPPGSLLRLLEWHGAYRRVYSGMYAFL